MNRFYLSAPTVETAEAVTNDFFKKMSLPEKRIQIVAEDLQAIKQKGLPAASIFSRKNILYMFERATLVSLLAGTLLSLLMIMIGPGGKPFGTEMFMQLVAVIALTGGVLGIVVGSLQDNHHLKDYRSNLDRSEIIIELKLTEEQSEKLKKLLASHPQVSILREDLDVCNRTISERVVKLA